MGGSNEFSVTVSHSEVLAAALPLQEHWLAMSNLDLLLPALDVGVFFCYNKPHAPAAGANNHQNFAFTVSELKKALAQTLVTYYAFGGEIVINPVGEPELLCNNRGVDFVEARADVELRDLNLHDPDESVEGKLVPKKKAGVLAIQVTELKCGGIVIACSFDHRVADAHSTNMFLTSWAETARAEPISTIPSFRRSVFLPRRPGHYDDSINDFYVPISTLSLPKQSVDFSPADKAINRIYHIAATSIDRIQALASTAATRSSKLEAFSAYLLQAIARCAGPKIKACSMGIVVNGRPRLTTDVSNYFGNVLSVPHLTMSVDELDEMETDEVAEAVRETVRPVATEEHFLGLVDWVEARRPEAAVTKVYCVGGEEREAFVISSGQRFPVAGVEFGWGLPVFGSYHFPWGGNAGYVMPMLSVTGNGDWVVYFHMKRGLLAALEEKIGDVLRPLTADHLDVSPKLW